jgi:hypothetical protein
MDPTGATQGPLITARAISRRRIPTHGDMNMMVRLMDDITHTERIQLGKVIDHLKQHDFNWNELRSIKLHRDGSNDRTAELRRCSAFQEACAERFASFSPNSRRILLFRGQYHIRMRLQHYLKSRSLVSRGYGDRTSGTTFSP